MALAGLLRLVLNRPGDWIGPYLTVDGDTVPGLGSVFLGLAQCPLEAASAMPFNLTVRLFHAFLPCHPSQGGFGDSIRLLMFPN